MLVVLMLAVLAATSLLLAASFRLAGLGATLVAAYVCLVAETVALTLVLSPFRAVSRGWLAAGEGGVLAIALIVWWSRGRPGVGLASGVQTAIRTARDPLVAAFLLAIVVALAYELALVLTAPADNWDSLTYHLARVAAWTQHGGVYWIPHAPTDRMNEFQPLAEQQILFLFVATGKGALFALPQFVAELAILAGIYTAARRLGFQASAALLSALLFASFTLVALEGTTSQNDLVAASLPLAAAAFLLGGGSAETILAGVAIALGLGVKLTTALTLPVLLVLAMRVGRRRALTFVGATATAFSAFSAWGFVLNVIETGHVLGHGGGRVEQTASPSFPSSLITAYRVLYRLLDLSGYGVLTAFATLIVGCALLLLMYRILRREGRQPLSAIRGAATVALPLFTPILAIVLALLAASFASAFGVSVGPVNARANEDLAAFGALGGLILVAVSMLMIWKCALKRQHDVRFLALALALPVFLVLLALTSKYNPWLSRFLIVPAALTAPLFGVLFRRPASTFAIVVVAAMTLAVVLVRNDLKPLLGRATEGAPWHLSQAQAVGLTWKPAAGRALEQLQGLVSARACIGAVLGLDEPSYLLYGPRLERPVLFLPRNGAPQAARRKGVPYVVIGSANVAGVADDFKAGGWALRRLSTQRGRAYWTLAISPQGGSGHCHSKRAAAQATASGRALAPSLAALSRHPFARTPPAVSAG